MLTRKKMLPENYDGKKVRELRGTTWFWCDKGVMRFFRHTFDRKHYSNLRSIYLALCEIASDFVNEKPVNGFKATLCTYSGKSPEIVTKYFYFLEQLELVSAFQVRNERGHFGRVYLYLSEYTDQKELYEADKQWYHSILDSNDLKIGRGHNLINVTSDPEPLTVFPGPRESVDPEITTHKEEDDCKEKYNNKEIKNTVATVVATEEVQKSEKLSTQKINENIIFDSEDKKPLKNKPNKKQESFIKRADTLAEIISAHIKINSKSSVNTWYMYIEKLYKDGIELKRIDAVLDWYRNNIGGEYVPQAYSARSFKDKFINIEQAMLRSATKPKKSKPIYQEKDDTYDLYKREIRKNESIICDIDDPTNPYATMDINYEKAIEMIKNNDELPKYAVAWVWSIGIQEGLLRKEDYPHA